MHRLAEDVFAQHRPDRGQTITAACERGPTRALQVEVAEVAARIGQLTEQQRTPIAQARVEPSELMTRVGLCHRRGTGGDEGADQQAQTLGAAQGLRVEPQLGCQRFVEHQQAGIRGRLRLPRHSHLRQIVGEAGAEGDGGCGCHAHAFRGYAATSQPHLGGCTLRPRSGCRRRPAPARPPRTCTPP